MPLLFSTELSGLYRSTYLEYADHAAHRRFERLGFDFVHWDGFKAGKESLCNAASLRYPSPSPRRPQTRLAVLRGVNWVSVVRSRA